MWFDMTRLKRSEKEVLFPLMKSIAGVRSTCGKIPGKVKDTVLNLNDNNKPQWDTGTLESPILVNDTFYRD